MTILELLSWSGAILLVIFVGSAVIAGIREAMNKDKDK